MVDSSFIIYPDEFSNNSGGKILLKQKECKTICCWFLSRK